LPSADRRRTVSTTIRRVGNSACHEAKALQTPSWFVLQNAFDHFPLSTNHFNDDVDPFGFTNRLIGHMLRDPISETTIFIDCQREFGVLILRQVPLKSETPSDCSSDAHSKRQECSRTGISNLGFIGRKGVETLSLSFIIDTQHSTFFYEIVALRPSQIVGLLIYNSGRLHK
jgi:hypothetical protein